ncbi:MAG: hypothetical protein EB120_14870, partial [Proteobacteria bacterium]|nr:hypothetical protein [Pseudomonadota bacterium]
MKEINKQQDGTYVVIDDRTLQQSQMERVNFYKKMVTNILSESGLDEATQQNAALGIYPPERCEAIKSYIAACRNEYLRCKALILAATTNDEAAGAGEPHQHDDKFTLCRQA